MEKEEGERERRGGGEGRKGEEEGRKEGEEETASVISVVMVANPYEL